MLGHHPMRIAIFHPNNEFKISCPVAVPHEREESIRKTTSVLVGTATSVFPPRQEGKIIDAKLQWQ